MVTDSVANPEGRAAKAAEREPHPAGQEKPWSVLSAVNSDYSLRVIGWRKGITVSVVNLPTCARIWIILCARGIEGASSEGEAT